MKPGVELDNEVALKVMGWTDPHTHEGELMMLPPTCSSPYQPAPPYSTNLVAAWDVVENLRARGYSIKVSSYPTTRKWLKPPYKGAPSREWELVLGTPYYQTTICKQIIENTDVTQLWVVWSDAEGETPQHSICLAALEALHREDTR